MKWNYVFKHILLGGSDEGGVWITLRETFCRLRNLPYMVSKYQTKASRRGDETCGTDRQQNRAERNSWVVTSQTGLGEGWTDKIHQDWHMPAASCICAVRMRVCNLHSSSGLVLTFHKFCSSKMHGLRSSVGLESGMHSRSEVGKMKPSSRRISSDQKPGQEGATRAFRGIANRKVNGCTMPAPDRSSRPPQAGSTFVLFL